MCKGSILIDLSLFFQVDGSGVGVEAMSMQDNYSIIFESRKFQPSEARYSIYDKELLAFVHASNIWNSISWDLRFFNILTSN